MQDICHTLADAVEEDRMLIDQKTGEVIGPTDDNTYRKEKLYKFYDY